MWFGSGGLVHKGLDLVLETFVDMPDYHLTICGPIDGEKDFRKVFYKELYQTANIHTEGWLDVDSQKFVKIARGCIGLIYPSCSEGGGGSVINCMHAGLIPIVSRESSVDVDEDYGIVLPECSTEEIRGSVRRLSALPSEKLKLMARKAWEFVRENHTRKRFSEEYRRVIEMIMVQRGRRLISA
jgi:glycosyltransferase involved in cell wall biosynthesis